MPAEAPFALGRAAGHLCGSDLTRLPPILRGALQLLFLEISPEMHRLGCTDPMTQF